jgi:undecaprenyl-diphosphatase
MDVWLLRLHHHDERILHALVLRRRRTADRLMHAVTRLGDAAVTVMLTLAMLAGLLPDLAEAGARAAFALVSSHLAVQLLKRTVVRTRPRLPVGYESLVRAPDRFSFPSGHAAASLSVALGLASVLPTAIGAPVLFLAGLVGVSRCYLGVHYPGDVAAGWLLAVAGSTAGGLLLG